MKKLLIGLLLLMILLMFLSIRERNSIVGIWESVDEDGFFYIFNKDSTCSYEMDVARLDCTYQIIDNYIIVNYDGNNKDYKYEYILEKENLTIIDDKDINHKFIRSSKKMK